MWRRRRCQLGEAAGGAGGVEGEGAPTPRGQPPTNTTQMARNMPINLTLRRFDPLFPFLVCFARFVCVFVLFVCHVFLVLFVCLSCGVCFVCFACLPCLFVLFVDNGVYYYRIRYIRYSL